MVINKQAAGGQPECGGMEYQKSDGTVQTRRCQLVKAAAPAWLDLNQPSTVKTRNRTRLAVLWTNVAIFHRIGGCRESSGFGPKHS